MPIKLGPLNKELQYLKNKLPQVGMFSTLDEAIQNAPQKRMTPEQWQQYLKPGMTVSRAGVNFPLKQEELQYSGLNDVLGQYSPGYLLPKEDLAFDVQQKRPEFNVLRNVQAADQTSPEKVFPDEYKALLSPANQVDPVNPASGTKRWPPRMGEAQYDEHAHDPGVPLSYTEDVTRSTDFGKFSSHFSPQDISWSRTTRHPVDDPSNVEGAQQKLLRLIEEIQSDRHEAAAEKVGSFGPDAPKVRRGYRTPEDEQFFNDNSQFATDENLDRRNELIQTPPDTPFKDPADYAGLELRKQLLNSVNQGDSYLGLTRGADQVERYRQGMQDGQDKGMSHIYDTIYPSALRKLARQYGAEVSDVPVAIGGGKSDTRPQTLVDYGVENVDDLLDRAPHDNEYWTRVNGLVDDFNRLGGLNENYNTQLSMVNNRVAQANTRDLTENERIDLQERLNILHDHWNAAAQADPASMMGDPDFAVKSEQKTFPAMHITPEVAERVRQAGVPLFTLAGVSALGGLQNNDENANPVEDQAVQNANGYAAGGTVTGNTQMPAKLDPLALVVAAKQRHYAYKPIGGSTTPILGSDYTPSYQQGKNPIDNPGGDANLRAQGAAPSNAAALAARYKPQSPLNPVEPSANGIPLPHFADGGEVITKVSKLLSDALVKNAGTTVRKEAPNVLAQKIRAGFVDPKELNHLMYTDPSATQLINAYQTSVDNGNVTSDLRDALANKLDSMGTTPPPQVQQFTPAAPKPAQAGPVQPNTQLNSPMIQQMMGAPPDPRRAIRDQAAVPNTEGYAEGGDVSPSSLKWLADMARKAGISSMAPDRARVMTQIAKQAYGLDENGNPVLGGRAWTSSQHGTPPRILDEMTSIPGSVISLLNAVNGKGPPGTSQMQSPKWSDDASARLDQLDKRVKSVTGVGDAQTLPEHIEDAAGMLATPVPASKVAKEAPMFQRALEYLTPVRPPTMARYATDSAGMGGISAGIDEIAKRLAARHAPTGEADPQFEDAAITDTNQGYAGGGSTRRDLLKKLAGLGTALSAGPVIKSLVKDTPDVVKSEAPGALSGVTQMPSTTGIDRMYYPEITIPETKSLRSHTGHLQDQLHDMSFSGDPSKLRVVKAEPFGTDDAGNIQHRYLVEGPPETVEQLRDFMHHDEDYSINPHEFPGWATHPDEVTNPHPVHQALQRIKDAAFGPSDEPNWGYLDQAIPKLPGGERVIPHYQAMKQAFTDTDDADSLEPLVHRFHQSLDDVSAEHGVPIAKDPNVENPIQEAGARKAFDEESPKALPEHFNGAIDVMKDTARSFDRGDPRRTAYQALIKDIPNHAAANGTTPEGMFAQWFNEPQSASDPLSALIEKHDPGNARGLFDYIAEDLEGFQ